MGFYSSPYVLQQFTTLNLYLMKIKEQTRKLAAGCSKECFEVVDRTDEVSNHIYGKAKLTWFEEIFEEYYSINVTPKYTTFAPRCEREKQSKHCQEGKKGRM